MKLRNIILAVLLSILILISALPASAVESAESSADSFRIPCIIKGPEEVSSYLNNLTDDDPYTKVTLKRNEAVVFNLPDNSAVKGVFFDFYERALAVDIKLFDAKGAVLSHEVLKDTDYLVDYPINVEGVASISVMSGNGETVISDITVYSDGFVSPFSDSSSHTDLLVILNRPKDELELYGGLLFELCLERGLSAQIVYMTKTDGYEVHQCMQVL